MVSDSCIYIWDNSVIKRKVFIRKGWEGGCFCLYSTKKHSKYVNEEKSGLTTGDRPAAVDRFEICRKTMLIFVGDNLMKWKKVSINMATGNLTMLFCMLRRARRQPIASLLFVLSIEEYCAFFKSITKEFWRVYLLASSFSNTMKKICEPQFTFCLISRICGK